MSIPWQNNTERACVRERASSADVGARKPAPSKREMERRIVEARKRAAERYVAELLTPSYPPALSFVEYGTTFYSSVAERGCPRCPACRAPLTFRRPYGNGLTEMFCSAFDCTWEAIEHTAVLS